MSYYAEVSLTTDHYFVVTTQLQQGKQEHVVPRVTFRGATMFASSGHFLTISHLQMRHEHEIPGLEPIVVNGVVINVAEDGMSPQAVSGVLGIDKLAQPIHHLQAALLTGIKSALRIDKEH